MTLSHSPNIVRDGLVLYLDAANKKSYLSTIEVEYLIVAGGGGGGGSNVAGGGGGGGVLSNLGLPILVPAFSEIYVGSGGIPGTGGAGSLAGGNGENSSAFGRVAIGGGGGGSDSPSNNGVAGGSGGGARGNQATVGGNGTEGQGNRGGDGGSARGGGGGGGAGLSGFQGSATSFPGGSGGDGFQTNIRGSVEYFAGGGGGGGGTVGRGESGEANTGGGGGGRGGGGTAGAGGNGGLGGGGKGGDNQSGTPAAGGSGGSGIVIVRYRGPQKAQGGVVTEFDGWTIHTFTSSGTLEVLPFMYDISGKKNSGTVFGPTFSSQNSGSFVFDGVDDYIETEFFPSSAILGNNFSWSYWAKYSRFADLIGSHGSADSNPRFYTQLVNTSGGFRVGVGDDFWTATTLGAANLNKWVNIAVTFNNGTVLTYLNGLLVHTRSGITFSGTSSSAFSVGRGLQNARFFEGESSAHVIQSTTLSANEVKQNFNALRGRYGL